MRLRCVLERELGADDRPHCAAFPEAQNVLRGARDELGIAA